MRPIIGVMPIYDRKCQNTWMLDAYFEGILEAGGFPVMLPITEEESIIRQAVEQFDGFLMTGGDDVDPALYEEEVTYAVDVYPTKDRMEAMYVREIARQDKPLLGICRGIQIMNAALGGTLYQDLQMENRGKIMEIHRQVIPSDSKVHSVKIAENSLLYSIIESNNYEVNSLHHQAVKETAPSLRTVAVSPDGIAEAVEHPDCSFFLGVQWHPELLFRKEMESQRLFQAFIQAAKNRSLVCK